MLATKVVMTFMASTSKVVLPYVQPDGDAGEFELSGKIGGSVQATEQFGPLMAKSAS